MKKKSLSGIQPSGVLHIGNYFGAIKQFIDLQNEYEGYYFIANYHALTSNPTSENLKKYTVDVVKDFISFGLDPNISTIFLQSDVNRHTELSWILSNITPMGLLERGHAYKDKVNKGIKPNVGLFTYPVLMASDILMYDVDVVPVGKDQTQHIEFTRDIAVKFNEFYGVDYFKLPSGLILDSTSIVPGTDGNKMSKSYNNTINMFLDEKKLKKQIMSIVTDSKGLEEPKDADNIITQIYSLFSTEEEIYELKQKFINGNFGYGHGKTILFEKIMDYFYDARQKRYELENNDGYIYDVLRASRKKMNEIVDKRMNEVKEITGLLNY